MSKNNENKLVPRLRFPEFKDVGAWAVEEVGNVFEVTRGYVLSMNLVSEEQSESNPFPVYSSQTKNNGLAGYYKDFLYEDAITWTTDGANAGDVNFRKGKFYCTNVCGVLINKNGFSNLCIASLINSVSRKHVSYIGNPKLMNGVMSKIKIPFPKIKEQQKIADCLSSLDEIVKAESQKLNLLYNYKKGLLQNLYPQEGETTPKFRFKEFENSGEWVEKRLGEVSEINPKVSQLPDEFVYIDLESVDKGKLLQKKIINREDAPSRAQRLLEDNDVIYQTVRPYQKNNYHFKKNDDYDYVASTGYAQLRAYQSSSFLFQLIHTDSFVSEVIKKCSGSNYPAINSSDLSQIALEIPTNIKEQQKIASCLSSIDDLINAQSQKIETLKLHKKGLLQGLFPTISNEE